ncbi:hypothetical protein EV1_008213 [Malus domestica]
MSESESLAAYLARLFDLINQMRSYGEDLSNQRIVQKLLISLPKTYDSIASVIENTKDIDVIDTQDVVAILKGFELRLIRHEESSTERAFASLDISSKNSKFGNQHTNTGGSKYQKNFKFKGKQWTNRFTPSVRNEANNTGRACKYCDKLHYGECWLKGKIKCHKCGKLGHIARICNQNKNAQQRNFADKVGEQRNFTNKVGEPGNLFMVKQSTEVKAVSDAWYIDSVCSNHMTSRDELLVEIDRSIKAKVQVGTGVLVDVKGKGTLVIDTDKGKRYIREVMLVPGIAENLLSVGQMTEHGYFLLFGDYKVDIFYDRTLTNLVVSVKQKGNRCFPLVFKSNDHLVLKTNVHQSSTMWHKRFGHLNFRSLQQLQEHDMVIGLPEMHDSEGVCQGCAFGKNYRVSFLRESIWRAKMPLELIHSDVCGPMQTPTMSGNRYFVTFIDDHSRMCWIYLLRHKSDVFHVFKKFKAIVELQSGFSVKKLRTDRGGEFTSNEFEQFCEALGLERQLTVAYSPQ